MHINIYYIIISVLTHSLGCHGEVYDYKDVFKKMNTLYRFANSVKIIMRKMWDARARQTTTRMLHSILAT